jgi:hypothetical protein
MKKRGELSTKEILEIVLATACILILVLLLYNLIAPDYDKTEKTSESYFKNFEEAIDIADKGGTGSFSIWQEDKSAKYYLVYFEKKISFNEGDLVFSSAGINENHICVCSTSEKNICNFCKNLNLPVKLGDNEVKQFSIGINQKINIIKIKSEDFYRFIPVK